MTPQDEFAKKIVAHLDKSSDDVSPAVRGKLAAARTRALAAQKLPELAAQPELTAAGPRHGFSLGGHGRQWVTGMWALLFGLALAYGFSVQQQSLDAEAGTMADFDSALLSLDAPLDALKDPSFLEAYSQGLLDQDDAAISEGDLSQ